MTEFIELDEKVNRTNFLITYSQANLDLVPSKQVFADFVLNAFKTAGGKAQPIHWAVCQETHADQNVHYHMVVGLSQARRWIKVKEALLFEGIVAHFADGLATYSAGYHYIHKEDPEPLLSDGHPSLEDLSRSSRVSAASNARTEQRIKRTVTTVTHTNADGEVSIDEKVVEVQEAKQVKKRRLQKDDVATCIVEKNIKSHTELYALAQERKDCGENDLSAFILSQGKKKVLDLLMDTWEMKNANEEILRKKKTRYALLKEASQQECNPDCAGEWYKLAMKLLTNNKKSPTTFARSVLNLLKKGRGKHQNLMLVGPANCGKTFLLEPLKDIYKIFANPAQDKYCWVGAEEAEVMFLNELEEILDVIGK